MTLKFRFASLFLATVLLGACTQSPPIFSLDGAATGNLATVVRLREGSMLLRGFDGKRLDMSKMPNPLSDFIYGMKPGTHVLWGINIQGGHPLVLENLRCYVIQADLQAGVIYRLNEDQQQVRAVLVREDTGAQVATGKLVDQKSAYSDACKWE